MTVSKKTILTFLSFLVSLFLLKDALFLIWVIYGVVLMILFIVFKRRLMFLTAFFVTVLLSLFCMTPILDVAHFSYGAVRRILAPKPELIYDGKMKETPVISIIMPAYNYEKLVQRALRSAATQDFDQPYEVVVVEDGSKDKTLQVLLKEAKKYPHVRLYANQKNQGLITTKNSAIALARGELIFNLDADDWLDKDALSVLYKTMKEKNADMTYTWFIREEGGESSIPEFNGPMRLSANCIAGATCVPNGMLYKKSDWQKFGGYSYLFSRGLEDWEFGLNFERNNEKVVRALKPIYHYYIKENSRQDALNKAGDYDDYYKIWWLLQIWNGYRWDWNVRWLFTYVGFKKERISPLSTMLEGIEKGNHN